MTNEELTAKYISLDERVSRTEEVNSVLKSGNTEHKECIAKLKERVTRNDERIANLLVMSEERKK